VRDGKTRKDEQAAELTLCTSAWLVPVSTISVPRQTVATFAFSCQPSLIWTSIRICLSQRLLLHRLPRYPAVCAARCRGDKQSINARAGADGDRHPPAPCGDFHEGGCSTCVTYGACLAGGRNGRLWRHNAGCAGAGLVLVRLGRLMVCVLCSINRTGAVSISMHSGMVYVSSALEGLPFSDLPFGLVRIRSPQSRNSAFLSSTACLSK